MLVSSINYTNFNSPRVNFGTNKEDTSSLKQPQNSLSYKVSVQKLLPMLMAFSLTSCDVNDINKTLRPKYEKFDRQPSSLTEQKMPSMLSIMEVFKNADLEIVEKGENEREFSISTELGDFDGTFKMDAGKIKGELNTGKTSYDYTMKIYKEGNIKAKLNLKNKQTKETQNVIIAEDQNKNLVLIDKAGKTHMLTDKMESFNGLPRTLICGSLILAMILLNLAIWQDFTFSDYVEDVKRKFD